MDLQNLGKVVIFAGLALAVVGLLIYLFARIGWLGRLPGDIRVQTDGISCFFPIVTMIVISIILTILLNIVIRLFR